MKVNYIIYEKGTGKIVGTGRTDRVAYEATQPPDKCAIMEVPEDERDKLSGENIDWQEKTGFMWKVNEKKKCLELREDCEICPDTGIPKRKSE